MTLSSTSPAPRTRYERLFFLAMACLFLVLAALGFTPSYQAEYSGQIKLHWFTHVHGAIMTSWLVVFLVQSLLAARGQLRYHRQLGLFSVGLGVLVWITMGVALVRAMVAFPPPVDADIWDIVTMSVGLIILFGVCFTAGIFLRKNPAAHKRLMLLATLILIQAAIDRIRPLPGLGAAVWVRFLYLDALLIPLFFYDRVTHGRIHRVTLLAGGFIVTVQLIVTLLWGSSTVHRFWFDRLAPHVPKVVEVKLTDAQTESLLGDYGWDKWFMTVYREGGKLYLKKPDQEPFELAATSETEFFMRKELCKLTFSKGADGRVLKLINQEPLNTWEAPRR